jgi:hypothetical protein
VVLVLSYIMHVFSIILRSIILVVAVRYSGASLLLCCSASNLAYHAIMSVTALSCRRPMSDVASLRALCIIACM